MSKVINLPCVTSFGKLQKALAGSDEKVYFFEPLEKEISVEDMQKIVDANEKLVRELKDGANTISK